MRVVALPLSLVLALGVFAGPAGAQEDAAADDVIACMRLSSDVPLAGVGPAELGQLLIDGVVEVVVLEPEVCWPEEPQAEAPSPEGTSYVKFVARGAGAAIELAGIAERHAGVDGLDELDAAARSVAAWAKQERKWLDSHPPQACYEDAHKQWRQGVVKVRKGAKTVRESVRTLKPATMRQAVRQLWSGVEIITSADLDAATETCLAAD